MSTTVPNPSFFTLADTGGLPTSQQQFYQLWLAAMQTAFPGYTPSPDNPEVVQAVIFASWAADVAQLCTSGSIELFRQYGVQLLNLPYEAGTPALAILTVTAVDDAGYSLSAYSQLSLTLDGSQVGFQTLTALTIPNGSTSGTVTVAATSAGTAFNGATNPVQMVSEFDWISSVSVEAAASGGVDQEDDQQYLDRLTATLQLLAPRPITASDYATMALNFQPASDTDQQEVGRATSVDGFSPNAAGFTVTANGTATLTVTAAPATGVTAAPGAFVLGTDLPSATFTATTALNSPTLTAVSSFANVAEGALVTGTNIPAGAMVLSFDTTAGTITLNVDCTGAGSAETVTISTAYVESSTSTSIVLSAVATGSGSGLTATVGGTLGNERTMGVCITDASGDALNTDTMTAVQTYLEGLREVNFAVNVLQPQYADIYVTVTVGATAGYSAAQVQANVQASILALLTPANFGLPQGATTGWNNQTMIYGSQIEAAIQNTAGVSFVQGGSLKFGLAASPSNTADLPLPGTFPLPTTSTTTVPTTAITVLT